METFRCELDHSYQLPDIHDDLSRQLMKLRQQSPERLLTPVHVLSTITDTVGDQIEERFREALKCHSGKRIILIPYLMDNHHWNGILLEWNSMEQIEQSEFINPVTGFDSIPDELQKCFIKIFPKNVLRSKIMLKDEDRTKSRLLTVINLLNAVQNSHFDQSPANLHTNQEGSTTSIEGNQMNFDELEKKLSSGFAKFNISDENILSDRIKRSQNRIKEYQETERMEDAEQEMNYLKEYEILAELAKRIRLMKSNVSELDTANLEKQLADSLTKLRITDIKALPDRIVRSEKRIEEYREEGRLDDVEKETAFLNECKKLQKLAEDIHNRDSTDHGSEQSKLFKLNQLEQRLATGLANINMVDPTKLLDRIERSEERIREFEEEKRVDDLEREKKYLTEYKMLKKLSEEICSLKSNVIEPSGVDELQKKLNDGLTKCKISNVKDLPEKIRRSEQRIKEYKDEDRLEEVENENKYLTELNKLQKFADELDKHKATASSSLDNSQSKLRELEEKLQSDLLKFKLSSVKDLSDKTKRSEQRIKEYKDEDRLEEAENENIYLTELNELQKLADELDKHKGTASTSLDNSESKLWKLEEKVESGLSKFKLSSVNDLFDKIKRSEERIKEHKRDGRSKAEEGENNYLAELNELQKVADELDEHRGTASISLYNSESKLRKLEEKVESGLLKFKMPNISVLAEKNERLKERISEYQEENQIDKAEKEQEDLSKLSNEIMNLKSISENPSTDAFPKSTKIASEVVNNSRTSIKHDVEKEKLDDVNIFHQDWINMHPCAEKTVMQLLDHFQRINCDEDPNSSDQTFINEMLDQLRKQIQKQELFSEKIQKSLQDLERYASSHNISSILHCLVEILSQIRPLDVHEIERLVSKAKNAAKLIAGKDIILLIGETGTGKSTTIQFLSGSKMKKTKVEVEPGRFLEHITIDGPIRNPDLIDVTSSAICKSETRYIAPVTIPLRDIYGAHEYGEIILCDAPGFGDTAGPEVDIANGVGVIEALKGCKSVKILALSSYKSLGDRGQGIQKLAHLLINMIHGIQDRLSAIFYAFTKYPSDIDISALLIDIKISKVDKDPLLRSDSAFVTVLTDMINKTKHGAEIIDPLNGDPKTLVDRLKHLRGIMYPSEVFQFSISSETQSCVANQAQLDNLSVKCALKHKDIDLVLHYLDKLKTLKDLLDVSIVRDSYEDAIRTVKETLTNFCTEITKKFNRSLASRDGLKEEDINEYKSSTEYIKNSQKLNKHFAEDQLSPESLIQNISSEIQNRNEFLIEEHLSSSLIGIYLNNVLLLKNSFQQIEPLYKEICQNYQERFEKLIGSTDELIKTNDFNKIADFILQISKCIPTLGKHLNNLVEDKYNSVIQLLLQYLSSFLEKSQSVLAKPRLNESEINTVKNAVLVLGSAKGNVALQDSISTYIQIMNKKTENIKSVNEIYNLLIDSIINYFNQINDRINQLFEIQGDRALDDTEILINDMDAIRTIEEIDSKTIGIYYRTVESIRGQMNQIQREVQDLLISIESQKETPNYTKIARLLSRMNNAKWMNRLSPGSYDIAIKRITEELTQYFYELEERLKKLDLSMKHPENIPIAQEIFDKLDSLSVLDRFVPDLKKSKDLMIQSFLDDIQNNFDNMQKKFQLQDIDIYQRKQELIELEQTKHDYDNLHPANVLLQQNNFPNIDKLNQEIKDLENKRDKELEHQNERKSNIEKELNNLKLKSNSNKQEISKIQERLSFQLEIIRDLENKHKNILAPFLSIKNQYESLITTRNSTTDEQFKFLKDKKYDNIESLNNIINQKKDEINKYQNNPRTYHFDDRFDATSADIALIYTSSCEKIANIRFKKMGADIHTTLGKYIKEYGIFLNNDIEGLYRSIITNSSQENLSETLEKRLEQLVSLSEYNNVFKYIDGNKKVTYWRRKFQEQYQSSFSQIEKYKALGNSDELHKELIIVQGLIRVDHFCSGEFVIKCFGDLYRINQMETTKKSKETYQIVLEYIKQEDYGTVDDILIDIDGKTTNSRDLNSIKQGLQDSFDSLTKKTLKIANSINLNSDFTTIIQSHVQQMNINLDKVRTVLKKPNILNIVDDKTKSDLKEFEGKLTECLSNVLLQAINNTENLLKSNDILEVELNTIKLFNIRHEIDQQLKLESVTVKINEIKKKLDNPGSIILEQNDYLKHIEQYRIHSPKVLVSKLQKADEKYEPKYSTVQTQILAEIRLNFGTTIDKIDKTPIDKRLELINPLYEALDFLPDALQSEFRADITKLRLEIHENSRTYKRELETFLNSDQINDEMIKKLNSFEEKYQKENQDELLTILHSGVSAKLGNYWKNVEKAFEKEDISSGIEDMKHIMNYYIYAPLIPASKKFFELISKLISKHIINYSKTLSSIFLIKNIETVSQAFNNLILCMDFIDSFSPPIENLISQKTLKDLTLNLDNIFNKWKNFIKNFNIALNDMNIHVIRESLDIVNHCNNVLKSIHECTCDISLIKPFIEQMKDIPEHSTLNLMFTNQIIELVKTFDKELISDRTTRFETEREQLFKNLSKSLKTFRSITVEFPKRFIELFSLEQIEKDLKNKIDKLKQKLLSYANKTDPSQSDTDQFRLYYNHLISIEKYLSYSDLNIPQSLESAEKHILDKVSELSKTIHNSVSDFTKVAGYLLKMKFFAENFSMFDTKINRNIDECLKFFQTNQGPTMIGQLTMILEKDELGSRLISEHSALSGEDWRKRREKMQNQDNLDYVLKELEGDDLSKDVLSKRYAVFRRTYDDLISKNLAAFNFKTEKEPKLDILISETKALIADGNHRSDSIKWDKSLQDKIPDLLAHIFAVWTLKNTQHYNDMRGIDSARAYLLMPHVAQVIAIFRIFGIGYTKYTTIFDYLLGWKRISSDLVNNLVEVGTGEGKSVILAIVACVFALMGLDVNCSCYSEYLSQRDKNDFASLFQALGIDERIEYGTFNRLCENFLNEQCSLRETVREMIMGNKNIVDISSKITRMRQKVLLIDEVDVFLSEKFYGGMYTPSLLLRDSSIKALLDVLWKSRHLLTLNAVKDTSAYKDCEKRFSNWISLVDEAIKSMLCALQSYQSSTYTIKNDRIVYIEGESFVENVVRGYDTIWAYYHENQKGFISEQSLETNVGIIVSCGAFSYAHMPKDFGYITGVSGTLRTLADSEKNILSDVYGIAKSTFMPSAFGKSNRNYSSINDVEAVEKSEYFMRIRGEIDLMIRAKRAILVFFESEERLLEFYNSDELASLRQSVQLITERVSAKDRETFVKRAATDGKVTLLTRTFGRGTDFICRNQQVLANGGIHVLQTFFSKELSEEYQIMGRGARQGDRGSYRMILLENDLEWILGADWKNQVKKIKGQTLYSALNKERKKLYETNCAGKKRGIDQCEPDHNRSENFLDAIVKGDMTSVKKFLFEQNLGPNIYSNTSRTVLLMDATGSMSNLLSATKDTVCTMFERASVILKEKKIPSDIFSMQFVVYRNYNSLEDKILEVSPWETRGSHLRAFMNTIRSEGGSGAEAIEIGLWHAVRESNTKESISQVILIGDAPANTQAEIFSKRGHHGEKYWKNTKFSNKTFYSDELKKLKDKNIPIHTFYLTEYAKNNFQEIARESKGRCESLDIRSSAGIDALTNYVTEEVLRNAAGSQGDEAVKLYREKYVKTSFTS
ncbi:unnamed protein product [Adineta steineri]|uniref:SecA family profile domain-containing protein n=1 Tax=Adineta steineri TaxID=433720 RepID=A0A814SNM9_9BILA|nr:unnamed protein product [Adineta steineri]CAF1539472.1 unnamed protein product [Adineta steineri]